MKFSSFALSTYLLAELGEGGVCEERDVAEQLVANVRLRGVVRPGVVPEERGAFGQVSWTERNILVRSCHQYNLF